MAGIGSVALPNRSADSEAGGSGTAAAEWPGPSDSAHLNTHEFNDKFIQIFHQLTILFMIFFTIFLLFYRYDFQYAFSHEKRPNSMISDMISCLHRRRPRRQSCPTLMATTLPKTRSSTYGMFRGVRGRLKQRKRRRDSK